MWFFKTDHHVLDLNLKRFAIWFRASNTEIVDVDLPDEELKNKNNHIKYVDCGTSIFIVWFTVTEPLKFPIRFIQFAAMLS